MASHREPSSSNKKRAPLVYRNFDLRLANYAESKGIGTFKVWVEGDPPGGGAMSPDEAVERTYDPQAFWRYPTQGRGGLIGGVETRRTSRADLFKLGQVLGGLVLPPGRVRELFEQSRASLEQGGEGLRLRLRVDSSVLGQLP